MTSLVGAMDLPVISYTDDQYLQVARYIVLRKSESDQEMRQKMDDFLAKDHSIAHNVNRHLQIIVRDRDSMLASTRSISSCSSLVTIEYNKDIFVAMCQCYLPKSYDDYGGFFDQNNYKGVREGKAPSAGHLLMGIAPVNDQAKKEKIPTISENDMIQKLREMDFAKALSVFRYITQKPLIAPSHRDPMVIDGSIKELITTKYTPGMHYYFSYDDLQEITPDDESLFQEMIMKFKKGIDDRDPNEFFEVKEEDVIRLKGVKEFILNNGLLRSIQVRVAMPATTEYEKEKNRVLFWIPHLMVMGLSDLVYSQINGIRQTIAGIIGAMLASGFFGGYGYRAFDSYNSHAIKLVSWFGSDNYKIEHRGGLFMRISLMHSACAAVIQKSLSLKTLPSTAIAAMITLLKFVLVTGDLTRMERIQNASPYNKRFNKKGKVFTLKDVVNGPKFKCFMAAAEK